MEDRELAGLLQGQFLVIDGPDGCGKSTQRQAMANWLSNNMQRYNVGRFDVLAKVVTVREPGGTKCGEAIRDVLLHRPMEGEDKMDPYTETLLFMAARVQLMNQVVIPAMKRGDTVLSDRFVSSTLAYQGEGMGVSWDYIIAVGKTVIPVEYWPVCTVLLDVGEKTAAERMAGKEKDRIESRDPAFQKRVRRGYLKQYALYPQHTVLVDASGTVEETFTAIVEELKTFMERRKNG